MKKVLPWRTLQPHQFPTPAGRGEWGWSEGAPGQYQSGQHYYRGRNAILTQTLHLKYTFGKRTVSNSTSLYTLFYSVIYNSVVIPIELRMQTHSTYITTLYNLVVGVTFVICDPYTIIYIFQSKLALHCTVHTVQCTPYTAPAVHSIHK